MKVLNTGIVSKLDLGLPTLRPESGETKDRLKGIGFTRIMGRTSHTTSNVYDIHLYRRCVCSSVGLQRKKDCSTLCRPTLVDIRILSYEHFGYHCKMKILTIVLYFRLKK